MKRYLAIGVATILLLSLSTAVVSCTAGKAGIAGTYVSEYTSYYYIEINKDGTFSLCAMRNTIESGTWEASGGKITFRATHAMGMPLPTPTTMATGEIKGNTLYLTFELGLEAFGVEGPGVKTVWKKGKPQLSP